jgi:hypothetical protein
VDDQSGTPQDQLMEIRRLFALAGYLPAATHLILGQVLLGPACLHGSRILHAGIGWHPVGRHTPTTRCSGDDTAAPPSAELAMLARGAPAGGTDLIGIGWLAG